MFNLRKITTYKQASKQTNKTVFPYLQKQGKHIHNNNNMIKIKGINNLSAVMVIDISQHQWSQFPNKKTQAKSLDAKTGSIIQQHIKLKSKWIKDLTQRLGYTISKRRESGK